MNAVIGITELTLHTDLSREQREYMSMVKTSADSLLDLINDILDFSKIEAGMLNLDEVEFNVRDIVERTVKTLALKAHQKGLELVCHIPTDVPDVVVGDPARLRQVLVNLVGNAIKFTETGEVVLRLETIGENRQDQAECELCFEITDTGIGIDEKDVDRLFSNFTQADASTTRRYGGTGLGLAISKQLVELMGGRIAMRGKVGVGTTLSFSLGYRVAHDSKAEVRAVEMQGLEVLVVDDNPTNRLILDEMLRSWGMSVTCVESGMRCLELLEDKSEGEKKFDLLLLDCQMPEMDGFMVAEQLKTRTGLDKLVVMMITSDDVTGNAERCKQLGIRNYLIKPASKSSLFNLIQEALNGSPMDIAEPLSAPQKTKARILLAEDNEINAHLATALLKRRGYRVTRAVNGIEALEKASKGDCDLVLMDVQMPEMDGLEATCKIRNLPGRAGQIPIVGLTAHALKEDRERCLAAGMDSYVAKPIRPETLYGAIDEVLSQRQSVSREECSSSIDLSELQAVLGDNSEMIVDLIERFKTDWPDTYDEMRQAYGSKDAVRLEYLSHNFKSVAGIFSAQRVVQIAQQLELAGNSGRLDDVEDLLDTLNSEVSEVLDELVAYRDKAGPSKG